MSKTDELRSDFILPNNAHNRVGRWTHLELTSLKLAMAIFGDQSWKKIQKFLIYQENENKKSKNITKGKTTYRSVKAIQSKIYQIKPEVETENKYTKEKLMGFDSVELQKRRREAVL